MKDRVPSRDVLIGSGGAATVVADGLRAIAFMCAGVSTFPFMNAAVK